MTPKIMQTAHADMPVWVSRADRQASLARSQSRSQQQEEDDDDDHQPPHTDTPAYLDGDGASHTGEGVIDTGASSLIGGEDRHAASMRQQLLDIASPHDSEDDEEPEQEEHFNQRAWTPHVQTAEVAATVQMPFADSWRQSDAPSSVDPPAGDQQPQSHLQPVHRQSSDSQEHKYDSPHGDRHADEAETNVGRADESGMVIPPAAPPTLIDGAAAAYRSQQPPLHQQQHTAQIAAAAHDVDSTGCAPMEESPAPIIVPPQPVASTPPAPMPAVDTPTQPTPLTVADQVSQLMSAASAVDPATIRDVLSDPAAAAAPSSSAMTMRLISERMIESTHRNATDTNTDREWCQATGDGTAPEESKQQLTEEKSGQPCIDS
jgi:hypothetical protein